MRINKHTLWHNVRTVSSGLFILGLIPLPFVFMGADNISTIGMYFLFLSITSATIVVAQFMVIRYKHYANTSSASKKQQKIFGTIGISLILLFILSIILLPVLGNFFQ